MIESVEELRVSVKLNLLRDLLVSFNLATYEQTAADYIEAEKSKYPLMPFEEWYSVKKIDITAQYRDILQDLSDEGGWIEAFIPTAVEIFAEEFEAEGY